LCPSWEPPPTGWLKLNVDAGIMQGSGTVWGLVVRNNLSEVIYTATKKCNLDVETLVCRELMISISLRYFLKWMQGWLGSTVSAQ